MIPGALLMTVAWLLIRLATVVYFTWRLDKASELYGGLGMAAVFLAWLYIISRCSGRLHLAERDDLAARTRLPGRSPGS